MDTGNPIIFTLRLYSILISLTWGPELKKYYLPGLYKNVKFYCLMCYVNKLNKFQKQNLKPLLFCYIKGQGKKLLREYNQNQQ